MRVTFFLVVVLILACFLPQGVSAQRRHSYGKNTVSHRGSKVKKTSIVRKARKRASTPSVTNPLLGVLIKQDVATVVPRCTEDSTNLVINIYSKELFFEPMKLEDGKILAFHQDVTKISEGSSMGSNMISKDSRWSPSFSNPKDLELAQKFEQEFSPTRMEFYPKLAQTVLSTIVLVKPKWYQEDVNKAYDIIKGHVGPDVSTNFVSECLTLPLKNQPQS